MPIATFDTLKHAKQLKQAGFTDEQAEAQVAALVDAAEAGRQDLATKEDVNELRHEVAQLRQEMKSDNAQLRADIKQMDGLLRADIKQMDGQLRADMKQTDGQLRADMKQMETSLRGELTLLRWMVTSLIGLVVAGIIRLLFIR